MLQPIEIKFNVDKRSAKIENTGLKFKSQDINVAEFLIEIEGVDLEGAQVKLLSVYGNDKRQITVNLDVVGGKAVYKPDANLISGYNLVKNYVYVYQGDQALDVRRFDYEVSLSEIDKTALKVKEVYDQSYSNLLADFELALTDYKDSLPQASDLRAEIDEVFINLDANESDRQARHLIAEQAESNRQLSENAREVSEVSREQAEVLRQESYESKVDDAIVKADVVAKVDSKVTELTPQINDIAAQLDHTQQQFNQAVGAVTEDSEVVLARSEYTTLKERLDAEKAEFSAHMAEKLQNFKLKNEVVNGDFSNGVTGWLCFYGSLTAINNELEVTVTSFQTSASYMGWSSGIPIISGRKYYASMLIKPKYIKVTRFQIGNAISSPYSPPIDVYTRVSDVLTALTTVNKVTSVRFYHYTDTLYSIGDKINFKNLMLIDITSIFGAGNEPTKLEMDELVKVIPNGWWDGELTLTQKQFITWQLNLIRKNTNAIIALGGTIV